MYIDESMQLSLLTAKRDLRLLTTVRKRNVNELLNVQ